MTGPVAGIDHTIIGVRDLEAARRTYARLGFTLTPRGRHIGWGTANYCIMFARDYVELLGIVDPAQFTNNLDAFLATGEGLLGLAFAVPDAAAAKAALAAGGIDADGPRELARDLELPEGTVRPEFRLVYLAREAAPGLSAAAPAFLCQHLTPDLMRRPGWIDHPNGAVAIASLTAVVEDPSALAPAYARLFGRAAVSMGETTLVVHAGRARMAFVTPAEAVRRWPESLAGAAVVPSRLLAMDIAVADIAATAQWFENRGVAATGGAAGTLAVPTSQACGVALAFVADG